MEYVVGDFRVAPIRGPCIDRRPEGVRSLEAYVICQIMQNLKARYEQKIDSSTACVIYRIITEDIPTPTGDEKRIVAASPINRWC